MKINAFTLLVPFITVVTQSPFCHTTTGAAVSPLQVLARYLKEEAKTGNAGDSYMQFAKALLFPGNMISQALVSAPIVSSGPALDTNDIYSRGLDLSTSKTSSYKALKSPELLLAGSWCLLFGSIGKSDTQHFPLHPPHERVTGPNDS